MILEKQRDKYGSERERELKRVVKILEWLYLGRYSVGECVCVVVSEPRAQRRNPL